MSVTGLEDELLSERLVLSPLKPEHADELWPLLNDERLHSFIGGKPLELGELRASYAALASRRSPDGREVWLNWIVRRVADRVAVGRFEATVSGPSAWVAWVVGTRWQKRGYASEAATAVVAWLFETFDVQAITALIHPSHGASERVAARAGLTLTDEVVDGERAWRILRRDPMVP